SITCFTASARNSSVYCLLLPINTSVIAINYGNRMSTKGWPVHFEDREDQDADEHADDEAGEVEEVVCADTGHDYDGGECIFCGQPEKED
ncbi:hypothetical protein, partial [Stenotrophomonas maltophilia group sp. Smal12]|uniref:hypothetical protein n=2 Tax=Stenotrophomonas maltophilia group TaxID=995085 RepID=UPI00300EDD6C